MDDAGLASRFASGDADSVRVVYQTYGRLVFSIASRCSATPGSRRTPPSRRSSRPGARAGSYDPSRPLGAWLTTIAKRVAIDVYRRERRHRNLDNIDTATTPTLVTLPPSVDQINDVAEVRRALDELPSTDRDLIRMQHFDELSHAEIARELEIPLGTVKSRTFRAHRRLAGLLAHLRAPNRKNRVPMDDADLTPAERAEIERVNDVLADPAVWAEPPPRPPGGGRRGDRRGGRRAASAAASGSPSWASPPPWSSPSA